MRNFKRYSILGGMFTLSYAQSDDFSQIVALWEASVRASHHFFEEWDVACFRERMTEEFLASIQLRVARDAQGEIVGFSGYGDGHLYLLFIAPHWMGKGVGRALLAELQRSSARCRVDCFEANEAALKFYLRAGFTVVDRTEPKPGDPQHVSLLLEWNGER